MRKYNAIRNAVDFGKGTKMKSIVKQIKPISEMKLIEAKRATKWIETGVLYEVVSEVDSFGYCKVQEPRCIGGHTHFIHKSNMKKVTVV